MSEHNLKFIVYDMTQYKKLNGEYFSIKEIEENGDILLKEGIKKESNPVLARMQSKIHFYVDIKKGIIYVTGGKMSEVGKVRIESNDPMYEHNVEKMEKITRKIKILQKMLKKLEFFVYGIEQTNY